MLRTTIVCVFGVFQALLLASNDVTGFVLLENRFLSQYCGHQAARASNLFQKQCSSSRAAVVCVLGASKGTNDGSADDFSLTSLSSSSDSLIPETSFGSEIVPEGQRPINEYLNILKQPLFGWAALESGNIGLSVRLVIVYAIVFGAVCYPISGATFTSEGFLLQKILSSNVGAMFVMLLLLIRLYSGWGYVGARLTSKVIEYEETGWYDGDVELKSVTEQKRDRMLFESKVKPVVERLKTWTLGAAGLWVASCISFNVATRAKPVFDEYDPAMLQKLRYDEKLAEKAAMNSIGRPTYCDNRYYRAIANDGQGCN